MDALCPRCAEPLALVTPGVAACPSAHGRAFTREAARARLASRAQPAIDHAVRRGALEHVMCPVCRTDMGRADAEGPARRAWLGLARAKTVAVHACPDCRVVWLDSAALAALE